MRGSRLKRRRFRVFAEACEVTRPVRLASIAITVVAVAMAMQGWQIGTGVLGGALVLIAVLTVYQVHRGVGQLHRRSDTIREAAEQAEDHYVQVLWRIVRVVESRDKYTEGHSERVADLTEQIARTMNLPPETCTKLQTAARLHDLGMLAVSQKILSERERLGAETFHTIELHPEIAHRFEIDRPCALIEIDLRAVEALPEKTPRYQDVSRQPSVRRDIAVLLARECPAGEVLAAIRKTGGPALVSVELFDRYEGEGIPEGKLSMAVRLVFQCTDRTLEDSEIRSITERVVQMLAHRFGGELR